MMLQPSDEKPLQTPEESDCFDRLSSLPDGLLLHILSFLPTENAAATSILSRRWRNLFIALPDINLEIYVPSYYQDKTYSRDRNSSSFITLDRISSSFITFGYRLIQLRNKAAPLRSFKLEVSRIVEGIRPAFDWLISATLFCKVQELEIVMEGEGVGGVTVRSFPLEIFTSRTLAKLHLNREVDLIVPKTVSLPNLKVLYLEDMRLIHVNSIRRLIRGCPLLEVLFICLQRNRKRKSQRVVEVLDFSCCPSLKDLKLGGVEGFHVVVEGNCLEHFTYHAFEKLNITVDAPNLQRFGYGGSVGEVKFIQSTKSIGSALIFVKHDSQNARPSTPASARLSGLIDELKGVESLYLSQNTLMVLDHFQLSLPVFKNLTNLQLEAVDEDASYEDDSSEDELEDNHKWMWKLLPRLLAHSPNLEVLTFDDIFLNDFCEDAEFVDLLPESIPSRFIEHLKEIVILKLNNKDYEFKVIEYLLKNVKSLKKMTIGGLTETSDPESETRNRIVSFKKCPASEDCQIVFKDDLP